MYATILIFYNYSDQCGKSSINDTFISTEAHESSPTFASRCCCSYENPEESFVANDFEIHFKRKFFRVIVSIIYCTFVLEIKSFVIGLSSTFDKKEKKNEAGIWLGDLEFVFGGDFSDRF
jgi:hypothetical protein